MIWAVLDRGGLAYRSSTLRYLRTVGSLTFSLRAIEAMDSPFLRRERIDCIWGMLIICLSGPFWWRYEAPSSQDLWVVGMLFA